MIIEHTIIGSKETSLHSFSFSHEGMDLIITPGAYFRAGEKLFESKEKGIITIPPFDEDTEVSVWLGHDGLYVFTSPVGEFLVRENQDELIDRLCWFTVSESPTSLDNVEIHVVKVVEK